MHAKVARVRHLIARQKVAERTEGVSTVYNVNLVVVCPETDGASKILGNLEHAKNPPWPASLSLSPSVSLCVSCFFFNENSENLALECRSL